MRLKEGQKQVVKSDGITEISVSRLLDGRGYFAGSTIIALPRVMLPCRTSGQVFKLKRRALEHAQKLVEGKS